MAAPDDTSFLFERLTTLAQEVFDVRHYSTAYYLLAADHQVGRGMTLPSRRN